MEKSQHEIDRLIRQVLIRYDVDITMMDYSLTDNSIRFTGELKKRIEIASEFDPVGICDLVTEITKTAPSLNIQFDFTNWAICSSGNCWEVMEKKDGVHYSAGSTKKNDADDNTVNIDGQESIADILKEISKKRG